VRPTAATSRRAPLSAKKRTGIGEKGRSVLLVSNQRRVERRNPLLDPPTNLIAAYFSAGVGIHEVTCFMRIHHEVIAV